ncbi:MAG: acyltransferase [Nitrospira defluvii]|nr:acyltransferase [Nitrospira defluvii]
MGLVTPDLCTFERLPELQNRVQTIRDQASVTTAYRPDIDGLRAVAVLSVVLYHAGLTIFSGGYVGVDVFFVISGFLITRLMVEEIEGNGRLDFGRFYLRRARRLLPAFFFTLVSSSIMAVCLFSPQLLEAYGASLIHAVLSASNFYFYSESGYFDTASSLKPLLHTWSLGVEEQFYLLWPIMLYLLGPRQLRAPVFVIVVGLVSLLLAQTMIADQAAAVFFVTPFRIYEFSIGATLVWLVRIQRRSEFSLDLLFLGGLALIACAVIGYSDKTIFPGVNALVPCLGAALCIYAGDAQFAGKILSNKLLVRIGVISYSLYLAHWPVMVFYKYYIGGGEFTSIEVSLLVVASFVTAIGMFYCIEQPFRRAKTSNAYFLLGCALLSLPISYIAASMWAKDGWPWRSWATSGDISNEAFKKGKERRFQVREKICQHKGWAACDDLVKGSVNALILGDSHAPDALNAFERIYPTHNFSMSALPACPPHHDIEKITLPSHPERAKCKDLNIRRFDPEYLRSFDYIVINILFAWYTPDHLGDYLEFLRINKIQKVIVLGDYLVLKRDMYELLNEYGYNAGAMKEWIDSNPQIESALQGHVEGAGYFFLSKRNAFCQGENCELFDSNKVPFTYDQHHLAYEFAVRLAAGKETAIDQYLGFVGDRDR